MEYSLHGEYCFLTSGPLRTLQGTEGNSCEILTTSVLQCVLNSNNNKKCFVEDSILLHKPNLLLILSQTFCFQDKSMRGKSSVAL